MKVNSNVPPTNYTPTNNAPTKSVTILLLLICLSISQTESLSTTNLVKSQVKLDFHYNTPLLESSYTQVLSSVTEVPITHHLRSFYDSIYEDPRSPDPRRFAWDPWYVSCGEGKEGNPAPNLPTPEDSLQGEREVTADQIQYSMRRTQCSTFFDEDDFSQLAEEITELGRSIGLVAITPPWLSAYGDGDFQNFHTDAPHGPMAFVLPLSDRKDFRGGETMLLKPNILDYWRGFDASKGLEAPSIVRYIPPNFGVCTAFDPRVPHGVTPVVGGRDMRKSRLVVHGWFSEPELVWLGPWDYDKNPNQLLDNAMQPLVEALGDGQIGRVAGYLAVRLEVGRDGDIVGITSVCDTLVADMDDFKGIIGYDAEDNPVTEDSVADVRMNVYETLQSLYFDSGEDGRAVIVPFAFE